MCLTEVFLVLTELCLFISAPAAPLGDRDMNRDSTVKTGLLYTSCVTAGGFGTSDTFRHQTCVEQRERRRPAEIKR